MAYIDLGYFGQLFDPVYSDKSDFNTNAKSYYDALARNKEFLKLFTEKLIQLHNELEKDFEDHKEFTQEKIDGFQTRLDGIKQEMIDFFNQWLADGVLDEVINQEILNSKASKRTVEEIAVSLEDYGNNIGDGVNDDAIPLRLALNHLNEMGGGTLLLPKNRTLLMKSAIDKMNLYNGYYVAELFSNITIKGFNTTIKLNDGFTNQTEFGGSSGGNVFISDNAENIIIDGVIFNYNGENNPQPVEYLRTAYGMVFVGGQNVMIKNCEFIDHPGNNCLLFKRQNLKYEIQNKHRNCMVIDCIFNSFGSDIPNNELKLDTSAIFSEWEESYFKRLRFTNRKQATHGRGGIELHASNQFIEDCYFEKCFPAIYMCNDYNTSKVINQIVKRNQIVDCHGGITFWNTGDVTFFIIEDNMINVKKSPYLIGNPGGIYQFSDAPNYVSVTDGVIRNNTINEFTDYERNSNEIKGITLSTYQNVLIENNTIRYLSGEGIALLGNPRIRNRILIRNNTFKNCFMNLIDTSKVYFLVNLQIYTAEIRIKENTFINDFDLNRYAFNFSWTVDNGIDIKVKNNELQKINIAIGSQVGAVKVLPIINTPNNLLGYIIDDNGVLNQWTRVTVQAVNTNETFNLPYPFKDDKYSIMITNALAGNNAIPTLIEKTATTFTIQSSIANKPFHIQAIGLS